MTVPKTSTNISLRAQNFWFINDNNQFWEILDVLWQDVMFLYSTCKIMWDGRIIRSMTSDSSNIDFFISHCMIYSRITNICALWSCLYLSSSNNGWWYICDLTMKWKKYSQFRVVLRLNIIWITKVYFLFFSIIINW